MDRSRINEDFRANPRGLRTSTLYLIHVRSTWNQCPILEESLYDPRGYPRNFFQLVKPVYFRKNVTKLTKKIKIFFRKSNIWVDDKKLCAQMPGKSDVGWIWKLTKKEISDELEKRGVQVDPNATRDEIRDTLVLLVHEEAIAKREAAVATEDKDKPAVELQGESIETQADQKVNASSTQCLRDTFQEYDSDSDNDMAENSTRIKFCLNKDKWETFVERLEFQFLARDTTIDAKKAAILLTSIDEDAYELIKNLCAPQKLSEKKYAELTKVMTDLLEPKPSELMERNNFYKASQEQGESIADFAARLKKLSLKCNFDKITESLRDQFVCGLSDKDTKIKLFETENLTFDTALKSAIARERAQRNAQSNVGIKHQQDVLAIGQYNNQRERSSHNNKQGPRAQPSRHLGREAKDNSCWNCGGRGHTRYQCPSPVTSKQRNDCASCGKPGHRRDVCKYKDATCGHCRKRGHIEDACFTKRANAKRGIQKIDKEGSEQDSDADEDAARSFENHHEDFYTLNIVENKFVNKHFVSGDRDGAPMYVDVLINDLNTRMEVDSGTYESVISNKIWREKFSNARLSDTPVELRGYDGTIMNPIEKRSENLKPLYDLANQKDYVWNDECTKSFAWFKNELISPRVLAHYDPKEQIVLASDASDYGLSAILSHRYKDNMEKPIAYASRIIPKKEQKRTILDKEAMAVVFGFKRFRDFIFGKEIILRTDNKSLQLILGPRKATNGAAENFVGIFKDKVSKIVKGGETVESAINKFLFDYRSIEHCTTVKSPYQMMYKRDMRTRFDVFRNNTTETVQVHQRAQIVSRSGSRRLELEKDDEVFIDDYRVNAEKRSKARIIKKLSPSTFAAKDEDNIIHKRHKDQIIKVPGSNEKLRRSPRFQNLNN
ncbi:unnamed protein product [Trichogramma brassicae]|uniref:CCHC-type domain-containing protein n=1 Tax=Trichogramma brassicae TaxID=86971 RepID=A0A6H5IYQ8_9HYME|nr:unnamed protein product [Trichogramma brassicae]